MYKNLAVKDVFLPERFTSIVRGLFTLNESEKDQRTNRKSKKIFVFGFTFAWSKQSKTFSFYEFLPAATKLGQFNIFRSVCQEFCPQGGVSAPNFRGGLKFPPPKKILLGCTPPTRSMRGWYASYWNAFLFLSCNLMPFKVGSITLIVKTKHLV